MLVFFFLLFCIACCSKNKKLAVSKHFTTCLRNLPYLFQQLRCNLFYFTRERFELISLPMMNNKSMTLSLLLVTISWNRPHNSKVRAQTRRRRRKLRILSKRTPRTFIIWILIETVNIIRILNTSEWTDEKKEETQGDEDYLVYVCWHEERRGRGRAKKCVSSDTEKVPRTIP